MNTLTSVYSAPPVPTSDETDETEAVETVALPRGDALNLYVFGGILYAFLVGTVDEATLQTVITSAGLTPAVIQASLQALDAAIGIPQVSREDLVRELAEHGFVIVDVD